MMRRMYGIPGRTGGAVVALAALAVGLAACGSSSSSTTTTTGAATTTTAASATTSTSGSTSTTRTSITGCASSGLAVTLGSANGTAGSVHYPIAFRNTTSSACTLYGFPGVSFLTAGGTQIGVPAQRESGVAFATITLAPNGLAYSSVGVTDPGIPPCTGSSTATQVRVFPPGETHAILVAAPSGIAVCSSPNTANYQSAIVTPMTASSL